MGGETKLHTIASIRDFAILVFACQNKSLDELMVEQFSAGKMPFPGKM